MSTPPFIVIDNLICFATNLSNPQQTQNRATKESAFETPRTLHQSNGQENVYKLRVLPRRSRPRKSDLEKPYPPAPRLSHSRNEYDHLQLQLASQSGRQSVRLRLSSRRRTKPGQQKKTDARTHARTTTRTHDRIQVSLT